MALTVGRLFTGEDLVVCRFVSDVETDAVELGTSETVFCAKENRSLELLGVDDDGISL